MMLVLHHHDATSPTSRYARCIGTAQITVRFPHELIARVDELVDRGLYPSRAAAVRAGVEAVIELAHRRAADAALVEGYRRVPPTAAEDAATLESLRAAIAEEPW